MEDEKKKLDDPGEWRQMPMEELKALLKEGIHIPKRGGGFYVFKSQPVNSFLDERKKK